MGVLPSAMLTIVSKSSMVTRPRSAQSPVQVPPTVTAPEQVPLMQSASSTHANPSASPPRQTFPADMHCEPGHCASFTQAIPLASPPRHTFWVPVQAVLPAQFAVTSQHCSAKAPPAQVPADGTLLQAGCAVQVLLGQSQGKPSSSPPTHTPWLMTHTPLGQSASAWHADPSLAPPEHSACAPARPGLTPAARLSTTNTSPTFIGMRVFMTSGLLSMRCSPI